MFRISDKQARERSFKRLMLCLVGVLLVCVFVFAIPQDAKAFGDFDSRSDYGSSSRSNSSDKDSGGIDLVFIVEVSSWLSDVLGVHPVLMLVIVAVAVLVLLYFTKFRKLGADLKNMGTALETVAKFNPDTINTLHSEDPGFSESELAERVIALYKQMQACWEQGDISPLRKDFMPDTWTRFNTQLQNKKAAGEITHVRNIQVVEAFPISYEKDQEHQILRLQVTASENIWITDREGKNIQGTEKTVKFFKFVWTMKRPLGAVTGGGRQLDGTHCPNCGAEIDLEAFAECPFCHTPIMKVSADWVISEIDAVSQRTDHK